MVTGAAKLNGHTLTAGDGVAIDAIDGEEKLSLSSDRKGDILLFDMTP